MAHCNGPLMFKYNGPSQSGPRFATTGLCLAYFQWSIACGHWCTTIGRLTKVHCSVAPDLPLLVYAWPASNGPLVCGHWCTTIGRLTKVHCRVAPDLPLLAYAWPTSNGPLQVYINGPFLVILFTASIGFCLYTCNGPLHIILAFSIDYSNGALQVCRQKPVLVVYRITKSGLNQIGIQVKIWPPTLSLLKSTYFWT